MFLKFNIYTTCLFLCLFTLKTNAQSVGGTASGGQTYCDTLNSGFLAISGYNGSVTTWQYSTNGGANWFDNFNSFPTQSYFNLKQSTCYRAIVQDGAFPPDTSSVACITVYLPTVGGTITGGGSFCGGSGPGVLNLTGHIGNVINWESSVTNGSSWTNIANTTATLAHGNITQHTLYRAIVQNSSFCLKDTSDEAVFTINPVTVAGSLSSAASTTVCYAVNSSTINLSGNVGAILNWVSSTDNGLNWNPVFNSTNILTANGLTTSTLFKAVVQSSNCSIDSTNNIKITVLSPIIVNAGSDTTISQGASATLHGSGTGTPLWLSQSNDLDNYSVFNPIATPIATSNFILTVTDANSCVNSDTVLVTVIPITFDGMISNVFSPNGDGINDTWYIENIKYYPNNEVIIYNIYGNIVYTKKAYNNEWDGTYNGAALPDGTYYYVVKIDESSSALKGSLDILKNK
ncbi:MAG: gliding motility-associated C-terminal domain-containing protein [Bacteroidota bacterium]